MINQKFTELYKKTLIDPPIYPGAIIKGTVRKIDTNYITISAFIKSDGYIPISQFKDEKGNLEVEIGNNIEVMIETIEDVSGEIKLSREKAKKIRAWENLEDAYKNEKITSGSIIAKVKGGFTVKLDILKAFLPGSLIGFKSSTDIEELKNKDFNFKIIKLEKKKNNIVVSQKFTLEEKTNEILKNVSTRLKEGNIVTGIVKNITDYGVFIDLGGMDGLLHITDMAWKRIKHPSDLVKIGSELKIKILKFDKNNNRISLGLKQLSKDPWNNIREKYKEKMMVTGTVTNITDYGCFVEIEEGIEGLIHLSEMDWGNKNINPKKIVKQGMKIKIIILDINTQKRRISLGLKQNSKNPWHIFNQKYKIGSKIIGKVKYISDFGVFIELNNYIDGLLHLSDISWKNSDLESTNLTKIFKKGDAIKTKIISIDPERERVTLSLKQLKTDPFINFITKNNKKSYTIVNNNKNTKKETISNILIIKNKKNKIIKISKKFKIIKTKLKDKFVQLFELSEKIFKKNIKILKNSFNKIQYKNLLKAI